MEITGNYVHFTNDCRRVNQTIRELGLEPRSVRLGLSQSFGGFYCTSIRKYSYVIKEIDDGFERAAILEE